MRTSNVMYGAPRSPPSHEMIPFRKAMKARNATKLAQIFRTIITAFDAPCAAASKALASFLY